MQHCVASSPGAEKASVWFRTDFAVQLQMVPRYDITAHLAGGSLSKQGIPALLVRRQEPLHHPLHHTAPPIAPAAAAAAAPAERMRGVQLQHLHMRVLRVSRARVVLQGM